VRGERIRQAHRGGHARTEQAGPEDPGRHSQATTWNCLHRLPGLHRLNIPIPLGGTSNHFRTDVLRELGAWDPYNVTEDADLGVRLTQVMGGGIILFMISQAAIILEVDRTGVWPWILFGLSANTTTLAYPVLSRHFPLDHAGRANTALNLPVFVGVFVGPHPKPWDAAI